MDQFPHDDGPRHKDQPNPMVRQIHATKSDDGMVRVYWSPVFLKGFQKLTIPQAIALMGELANAIHAIDKSAASEELVKHIQGGVMTDWEVGPND